MSINDNNPEQPAADVHERFMRLFAQHEPAVRAYVRAGLPSWNDVDEVMQDVSVVAWRKFEAIDEGDKFAPWLCMIARYEVLKYRRTKARDRLVLDDQLVELILQEGIDENDLRQRQRRALEQCLEKLSLARRELVLQAYVPGRPIHAIASQLGRSSAAMYQTLSRIRRELLACVDRTLSAEGSA